MNKETIIAKLGWLEDELKYWKQAHLKLQNQHSILALKLNKFKREGRMNKAEEYKKRNGIIKFILEGRMKAEKYLENCTPTIGRKVIDLVQARHYGNLREKEERERIKSFLPDEILVMYKEELEREE